MWYSLLLSCFIVDMLGRSLGWGGSVLVGDEIKGLDYKWVDC